LKFETGKRFLINSMLDTTAAEVGPLVWIQVGLELPKSIQIFILFQGSLN